MPELPEVQTVINYLKENIINSSIINIDIKNDKFLKNRNKNEFIDSLINKKILSLDRRGKYLIFNLSDNLFLISHLRMEGKYFIDSEIKNRKHDYLIFHLSNNKFLSYNDSRQFGTFHLTNSLNELKEIKKIAIDPLDKEFNYSFLKEKMKKSKKNIKTFLLDQSCISGIGNIYASEILFDARISPFKRACDLNQKDIENIVSSSITILKEAIKYNGTTIHSFSFGQNKTGEYNNFLKVVYRENKKCFNCDSMIERTKQQGRSTFFCSKCQK